MQVLMAFTIDLIFGLGLLLSGMMDPSKVIIFWILLAPGIHHFFS